MQLLFTFFCENVNLIQQRLLSDLINKYCKDPVNLKERIKKLIGNISSVIDFIS